MVLQWKLQIRDRVPNFLHNWRHPLLWVFPLLINYQTIFSCLKQGATRNKFCWLRNCSIAKLLVAFLLSLLLLFCWCCFFARKVCCFFAGCCFFAYHFAFLFCFVAFLLGTFHCFFALLLFCLNEQQSNTSKKATSSIEQKSNTSNKATDFFSKKATP